jgi:predicted ATPase/DNA-binding winged helix-turn-helix (wHTH) protein
MVKIMLDNKPAISFGPFQLFSIERRLQKDGKTVRIGSRALDILIALVERPGELISKNELTTRAWPNVFVEEGNLKVQVAALRRALDDKSGRDRYIVNTPGRGYRFIASIKTSEEMKPREPQQGLAHRTSNLPVRPNRLIGRTSVVKKLATQLTHQSFVTIVGPGGVGKSCVARAVAESLIPDYEHGVWLIDLAELAFPLMLPGAFASTIGLEIRSKDPLTELTAALRNKRMLLVLDNCAHVIAIAADFAAAMLNEAPDVHILATSREPLRAEREHVHRLSPLESPSPSRRLTAAEAISFPAVQLFVECASASLGEFKLSDADAPTIATICRKLDGIPLAIEIAASRVHACGIGGLAARLEDGLGLLTSGRRTAQPRHQTMSATLDWSYGLLTEAEQTVLRRLAIFDGEFTLHAAAAVVADKEYPENKAIELTAELVTKSLIAADASDHEPRLRLLETTRAYALGKLTESGEFDALNGVARNFVVA